MINVKDLKKVYEERMGVRDKNIVKVFENFIDKQLVETGGKSKITKWDFLMIVDKAIGRLSTKDYISYKKAFECVENELAKLGMKYIDEIFYTKEATLLKYMFKKYRDNGYFIKPSRTSCFVKPSRTRTIYIER